MATYQKRFSIIILILAILFTSLTSACGRAQETGQPAGTQVNIPDNQPESTSEPTVLPSPTRNVGKVWIVASGNTDRTIGDEIRLKLEGLSNQAGYITDQSDSLNSIDFENTVLVVYIGDEPDVNNLAVSHPETNFVKITSGMDEVGENLSLIRTSPVRVSFVAGFISILVATDRRAAGLFSAEDPNDSQLQNSFGNGGSYLCGRCVPVYAPVVFFPVTTSVPATQGFDSWKTGFDTLNQNRIEVLYLASEFVTSEMLNYLQSQSVIVVGSTLPPDGYNSIWVATVEEDPASALEQVWQDVVQSGSVGIELIAPLAITRINDQLLTPGKLIMVEKVVSDILEGWIEPLSIP